MPDLVVNTGPLIALCAALEDLHVLTSSYQGICVPHEVVSELGAGPNGGEDVKRIRECSVFEIQQDSFTLPLYLSSILDAGEAAVIETALRLNVERVAIDEKIGRRIARLHGLYVTGSVGILLKCAKAGGVQDLEGCFIAMRQKGIWISETIYQRALNELNSYDG